MNNPAKSPQLIKPLFDSIARSYDKLNDIMSFGLHRKIKKDLIDKLNLITYSPSHIVTFLDLCTGTGDIAWLLKKKYPKARVVGIDFSEKMLEIARAKEIERQSRLGSPPQQQKAGSQIEFIHADCAKLPFDDESVDLCTISFGLRNVENLEQVLKEIKRVLKKDGIFINLDLGKPNRFFNLFLKPYMYLWVALLGKIFHGNETPYKYLAESNETFPSQYELVRIFEMMGFSEVKNTNYLFGQIASQVCRK